ncbi:MAG TPA: hypothetical protein VK359_06765, partial [Rubrobacteraceae bacterium]|nr:hypothetical protein [Rubrobacteraceae bacterium]
MATIRLVTLPRRETGDNSSDSPFEAHTRTPLGWSGRGAALNDRVVWDGAPEEFKSLLVVALA